jgi:hypothetical protein
MTIRKLKTPGLFFYLKQKMTRLLYVVPSFCFTILVLVACGYNQKPEISAESAKQLLITTIENDQSAELMEQVHLFLNYEGAYAKEEIPWIMYKYPKWKGDILLGLIMVTSKEAGGMATLQGVFLGYLTVEDGFILFMGEEDGSGSRFVTPLKFYNNVFEARKEYGLAFTYDVVGKDLDFSKATYPVENDITKVYAMLDERIGMVLGYYLSLDQFLEFDNETKEFLIQNGCKDIDKLQQTLIELSSNTIEKNLNLLHGVWRPSQITDSTVNYDLLISSYGDAVGIPDEIDSLEDIKKMMEPGLWLATPNGLMGVK